MEGGEIQDREKKMPKKKEHPILTYILVIILLMIAFAAISPNQFQDFINMLRQFSQLFFVLAFVALIAYVLRKLEKI